ncbi:uncharacterized protein ACIBXB_011128 isoform 1-T2 [Morphnus guianensis]
MLLSFISSDVAVIHLVNLAGLAGFPVDGLASSVYSLVLVDDRASETVAELAYSYLWWVMRIWGSTTRSVRAAAQRPLIRDGKEEDLAVIWLSGWVQIFIQKARRLWRTDELCQASGHEDCGGQKRKRKCLQHSPDKGKSGF